MAEFHDLKSEVQSWNLYTDEKLVSKLDGFLNHMMAQCEIINKNTEQTLYETNAVSIYLSDTFNALSNLSNKKFIENCMAPLEEPQIVPKETKQFQEMTVEKKQENFQKALKNVIDAFNITTNDEDEMTLSKSNTLSMATMFKTGDHLPFIIGSKAFNQDEFIGIVDRTDDIDKYLRGLNKDALGDDSPTAVNGQYAGGSSSNQNNSNNPRSSSMMIHAQPVTNLPPIPGATNRVAINNTTLGPPPPLQQLLQQYDERGAGGAGPAGGRGGLLGEIQQRGQDRPPNPMGRGNLLGEIAAAGQDRSERAPTMPGGRGNLLGEIAAAGQDRSERPPNPMGGRGNLLGEIAAAGGRSERQPTMPGGRGNLLGEIAAAGQDRSERPPNPMGGRGGLLAEIAQKGQDREAQPQKSFQQTLNDQLGGGALGQPRPAQPYGMQDEGPTNRRVSDIKSNPLYQPLQPQQTRQNRLFDEDEDDEIGNKDMFRSSNAKKKNFDNLLNPMAGAGNPMLSSMAMNNANPFDPFGLSNPFMPFNAKSANAQAAVQRDEQKKQPQPERDSLASMANTSVYEDKSRAYDDEKKEEKKGNRLTKLFEDSDEDEESRFNKQRLLSQKYRGDIQPRFEDKAPEPVVQQKQAPAANNRVSKLFDDEEDGDFLSKKPTQPKKEVPKPKLIEQDEDDSPLRSLPKKKEDPVRQSKPTKPSLFDDDDDDVGMGMSSLRASKKPEPAKKKKGVFDDDDDDILEEKKETLKPKPAQKSLTTKKSLFDNDDEEEQQSPPKKIAPPVLREEPKPIVREEPKPVIYEEPKPVVREEPRPVIFEQPKPVVREEPKIEPVQPRQDFRPLAQEVLEIKEDKSLQDSWAAPKTAGTQNLTQMIKAAALAKKKKNSSDESDSDESDSPPPVRKPVTVTPVQPVVEQEPPRVVEEPKVQTWQQEKPVTREEEPELYSPITNTRGSAHIAEPIVEKVEPPREEKHEEERHSVTKQPSGVSSRISDLQSKLNLNMMALKPGEGLPEHMRKAKLSVMREEDSPQTDQSYAESRTQSEAVNENPGGISHMAALEKPAMQARAKKTIMFEDDDEDEPKEIKKPAVSYNPPPAKVETPVYEEPKYTQPAYTQPTYTQPAYTQPAARNDSFEEAPATRASTKKKVAWGDDDDNAGGADPLGFSPKKTQAPTTSSANDPMALLRGIPGVGETKSISKKSSGKDMFRDDDDEDLGLNRKSNTKPAAPAMPTMSLSDPNNPLALLSGLKKMDEGRKSTKGKSKGKSKLFDDDDDDGPPVLRPSTKVEESRPSTKARPSEKSKLFNDSDEDGDFLKKKPVSITKPQQKAGPKKTLFDDSD